MTNDEIIGNIKKYHYFAYNYISIKKTNTKIKEKLEINSNPVWSKFPSNKLVKLLKQKEMQSENMTQDEIIEMARQAELIKTIDCCGVANKFCSQDQWKGNLSIFAKLVAQNEREACAKLCEEYESENDITATWLNIVAEAIRARGEALIRGQA